MVGFRGNRMQSCEQALLPGISTADFIIAASPFPWLSEGWHFLDTPHTTET